MFDLTANFEQFLKAFNAAEKGLGFARTIALTRTAKATQAFLSDETRRVFDRPTPFAQNAIAWFWATPDKSSLFVWIKDAAGKGIPATKYLFAQIMGGTRRKKRSEVALTALMGNRSFWVPGAGIQLDAYGNVPGGTIKRILSDLQVAEQTAGFSSNRTARSVKRNKNYARERYFVPKPGSKLHPGVWVRRGNRIEPALLFVTETHYEKRFDFFGRGQAFAAERFPVELSQAIAEGWNLPRATQKALGLGSKI